MIYKSIDPLFNNVVLKKKEEETEQMHGNIFVPDMGKEKAEIAEVIFIGPGFYTQLGEFISTTLKPGDVVLLPKLGAQRITLDKEEYLMIKESEILGKLY
jgi:chaperonin GroES